MKLFLILFLNFLIFIKSKEINKTYTDNITSYYKKIFNSTSKDRNLQLKINTTTNLPYIFTPIDLKGNTTLFKIKINRILTSCIEYPYKEHLTFVLQNFFKGNSMNSDIYTQAFSLVIQILYFKYADKKFFKEYFNNTAQNYTFELNDDLNEYVDYIFEIINNDESFVGKENYNHTSENYNKLINKYELFDFVKEVTHGVYEYLIATIKNVDKNSKENILTFLGNKKTEFIRLFYFINKHTNPLTYDTFKKVFFNDSNSNNTNQDDYDNEKKRCLYLTPITDILDLEFNKIESSYSLYSFPLNNSLLYYSKDSIQNGEIKKNLIITSANGFFDYGKKYVFNTDAKLLNYDIIFKRSLIDNNTYNNFLVRAAKMTGYLDNIYIHNDDYYKTEIILSNKNLNSKIFVLGRLLYFNEKIEEKKKQEFYMINLVRQFVISNENEINADCFYYSCLNKYLNVTSKIFDDLKDYDKYNEEEKDLLDLVYMNYEILYYNYVELFNKMENDIENEIKKIRNDF